MDTTLTLIFSVRVEKRKNKSFRIKVRFSTMKLSTTEKTRISTILKPVLLLSTHTTSVIFTGTIKFFTFAS